MPSDAETVLQVGFAAALADGRTDERELGQLRALARAMGVDAAALGQSAALPEDLAARLSSDEARRAAYELAVAVCHCDGAANDAEAAFLGNLRATLGAVRRTTLESSRSASFPALALAPQLARGIQ